MASALHQENRSPTDYAAGLPVQLLYLGLLVAPLVIAGFVMLWRTPELRFIAVTATLIVVYVLAWIPGKVYYTDGVAPAGWRLVRWPPSAGSPARAGRGCGAGSC